MTIACAADFRNLMVSLLFARFWVLLPHQKGCKGEGEGRREKGEDIAVSISFSDAGTGNRSDDFEFPVSADVREKQLSSCKFAVEQILRRRP